MKRRRSVIGLLGIAAAAAAGVPIYATAGPSPNADAPDLRADPPEAVGQPDFYSTGGIGTGRLLVQFDGFVTNVGQGPLEVSGNPQVSQSSTSGVRQRARTASSAPGVLLGQPNHAVVGSPPVEYEEADGHDHFHLMRVMRYSLWNSTRTGEAAPGQKVGFCLYDIEGGPEAVPGAPKYDPKVYSGSVTQFCDQYNRETTSLVMGTSAGWRDVYGRTLPYQWVDVSDTPPGEYYVAAEADPDNLVWEGGGSGENNTRSFASTKVTVPGWVAQPVSVAQTGQPLTIPLSSAKFGSQSDGQRRYRIIDGPDNGTLDVPIGSDFTATSVTYRPSPGYAGSDSFTYVAKRDQWAYPFNPPQATVAIGAAEQPSVSISGAPASLIAGTSAQLAAATANVSGPVMWSVDGAPGGNAEAGTVTADGLYTAPQAPPPGGSVTVGATAGPASAQAAIRILPKPSQVPPLPGISGKVSAGSKLLSRLRVRTVNRRFVVGKVATGRKAGRVTISVTFKRKVLGRCIARVPARKAFTCRVKMPRQYPLAKVRVTAKLKAGKATAVRRSFARR